MTPRDPDWLSDASARQLFQQFPLALVMVSRAGAVLVLNDKFRERFDPACLSSATLQALLTAPGPAWHPVPLLARDGAEVPAHARSLHIQDRVMLVIDEEPGSPRSGEVERLHERVLELERESATDPLTGAWNRAHLERVVVAEIARSVRFRQPLSIVLMDIDHFKSVNDTHGHQAGDAVLKHVVALVRAKTRSADLLFRWGGEEFVVLATSAGYRAAETVAEGLRRAVQESAFPVVRALTVSLGVAEHLSTESAEAWFARADAMLYAAKKGGRNRVSVDRRGSSDAWAAEHGRSALRLEWREAYECGEPTIDGQHRTLFDLANALIDSSVESPTGSEATLAAMDRLIEHVVRHFADEEALLEKHGYARLEAHRQAHARLCTRAFELRDDMRAGSVRLGDVVEFLAGQVVARHLFTADRDFYPLFQAQAERAGT